MRLMTAPVGSPSTNAGDPDWTILTMAATRSLPGPMNTTMKHTMASRTFMITPAEMIAMRCQTVLFLYERGSSSPSSVSVPSPTILT